MKKEEEKFSHIRKNSILFYWQENNENHKIIINVHKKMIQKIK